MKIDKRVAIVTGASRGIGFEVGRQLGELGYQVVITAPTRSKGEIAQTKLRLAGHEVIYQLLDVTNRGDIRKLKSFLVKKLKRVDLLVNNSGVMLDEGRSELEGQLKKWLRRSLPKVEPGEGPSVLDVNIDIFRATLEVNTLGALALCQAFVPLMIKAGYGRVVNVSSSRGQLRDMGDDGAPAYQMSKAALNTVTLMVADAARGKNVLVNSVCPGWTRTDLGGPNAPRSVAQAAETIIWLATLPDSGPSGGFFRDKKKIDW